MEIYDEPDYENDSGARLDFIHYHLSNHHCDYETEDEDVNCDPLGYDDFN